MKDQVFAGVLGRANIITKYVVVATVYTIANGCDVTSIVHVDKAYSANIAGVLKDCRNDINYLRVNVFTDKFGGFFAKNAEVYIRGQNMTNFTLLNLTFVDGTELVFKRSYATVGSAIVGVAVAGRSSACNAVVGTAIADTSRVGQNYPEIDGTETIIPGLDQYFPTIDDTAVVGTSRAGRCRLS